MNENIKQDMRELLDTWNEIDRIAMRNPVRVRELSEHCAQAWRDMRHIAKHAEAALRLYSE